MSTRSWILRLLAGLLLVLGALSLVNAVIDHSRLFGTPDIEGLNRWKPFFFGDQFISKPYTVRRIQPDAVILGTSRAGASLDPEHPGWEGYRPYNFALAGTSMEIQWWNFQHALEVSEVRRAVLAMDFMMFNSCTRQGVEPHYQMYRQRLAREAGAVNWRYPVRFLIDHLSQLTSLESTRLSWLTWRAQGAFNHEESGHLHLRADGLWRRFPAPDESQHHGFLLTERNYLRNTWFTSPAQCYALEVNGIAGQLNFLERIIGLAHQEQVELILYFSPFHARLAEAMVAAGLWDTFEELKRRVVSLNAERAFAAGKRPFPLWDFSGYNEVNTETIPAVGDTRTRMRYYVDGTHSTPAAGDLVQDVVFDLISDENPEFGVRLEAENVDQVLKEQRAEQAGYRAAHALQFRELLDVAAQMGRI